MSFIETSKAIKRRAEPTMIMVGDRRVISTGKWNDNLMATYIVENGRDRWIDVGELAKVAYGANMKKTQDLARKHVCTVHAVLLARQQLLAIDRSGDRGRIKRVKIYVGDSALEQERMVVQLERMRRRGETSTNQHLAAMAILNALSQASCS